MKAISIHQPWATLVVHGKKRLLAMNRHTKHRGDMAIHTCDTELPDFYYTEPKIKADLLTCVPGLFFDSAAAQLPHGQIIGIASLAQIIEWENIPKEMLKEYNQHPDIRKGSCIWVFGATRQVTPFQVRGRPAVFSVNLKE